MDDPEADRLLVGPHSAFPTLEQLSVASEEELRAAGFGYRRACTGVICMVPASCAMDHSRTCCMNRPDSAACAHAGRAGCHAGVQLPWGARQCQAASCSWVCRAKFIVGSVRQLHTLHPEGGEAFLQQLRDADYAEASEALCTLPGVGPKVRCLRAYLWLQQDALMLGA